MLKLTKLISKHVKVKCAQGSRKFVRTSTVSSDDSNNSVKNMENNLSNELLQNFLTDDFSHKKQIIPDESYAMLFPGQGSQFVGMAKNLLDYPNVKNMFESASNILGYDLLNICTNGPESILNKTLHCQAAIVVTSLAAVEKIQQLHPHVLENCYATSGYSVGEYTALIFSGVLSFEDGMKLIKIRSEEMQKACNDSGSGMIVVYGSSRTQYGLMCQKAKEYCSERLQMEEAVCSTSGYLSPNVRTIAGHRPALEFIAENKKHFNLKKVTILPVSGAFHTYLMRPAYIAIKEKLKDMTLNNPVIKVYANIDGSSYRGFADIKNKLPKQIIKPVYWEQTMHAILKRPADMKMINVIETGPGSQLGTLLRQCNQKAFKQYTNVKDL